VLFRSPFYFDLDWCYLMKGDSVQLYPNPANDYLEVNIIEPSHFANNLSKNTAVKDIIKPNSNESYLYCIIDNSGRPLYQKKTSAKNIRINTAEYIQGIYLLKVFSSKGITDKKIIITH
jgi:hypothetical protein